MGKIEILKAEENRVTKKGLWGRGSAYEEWEFHELIGGGY